MRARDKHSTYEFSDRLQRPDKGSPRGQGARGRRLRATGTATQFEAPPWYDGTLPESAWPRDLPSPPQALVDDYRRFCIAAHGAGLVSYPPGTYDPNARTAVLVIDASTSMDNADWWPSRLAGAKTVAVAYVQRLRAEEPGACLAVVAFGQTAKTICCLVPVRELCLLDHAIHSIDTSARTNMTAGLNSALRAFDGRPANGHVTLFADGHHNYGDDPRNVAQRLRDIATVECVGIGASPEEVNEPLLMEVASAYPDGSKRYRWIGDQERLVEQAKPLTGRITRP